MGIKELAFLMIWVSCILCHVTGFTPVDSFLIDCGSLTNTTIGDRVFLSDTSNSNTLATTKHIFASTNSSVNSITYGSPLYQTARIFEGASSYTFKIRKSGRLWIRLYFFPFIFQIYDMSTAKFSVTTQQFVLLRDFQLQNGSVLKEFSVNVNFSDLIVQYENSRDLVIQFTPARNSFAFLNSLEVVSVPDELITDDASNVVSGTKYQGLTDRALETLWRVNMGGPAISPLNDSLSRTTWIPDQDFLTNKNIARKKTGTVKYVDGGPSPDIAPEPVYGTAIEIDNGDDPNSIFNVTWNFDVEHGFQYLVRFHFCDIISVSARQLVFNVYINAWEAYHNLEFYSLSAPLFLDFVTEKSESTKLEIGIGPSVDNADAYPNAILNGLEIMKITDFANSRAGGGSPLMASSLGLYSFVLYISVCLLLV